MFYPIYEAIKYSLGNALGLKFKADGSADIKRSTGDLHDIQWFNNQYEGVIHDTPILFVEFEPVDLIVATKDINRADIRVRLHLVTQILGESDSSICDLDVIKHETLATQILAHLTSIPIQKDQTSAIYTFTPTSYSHLPKYNSWAVTLITLRTKTILPQY